MAFFSLNQVILSIGNEAIIHTAEPPHQQENITAFSPGSNCILCFSSLFLCKDYFPTLPQDRTAGLTMCSSFPNLAVSSHQRQCPQWLKHFYFVFSIFPQTPDVGFYLSIHTSVVGRDNINTFTTQSTFGRVLVASLKLFYFIHRIISRTIFPSFQWKL